MSSSINLDNQKENILILGEGPTLGSNDTPLTAEKTIKLVLLRLGTNFV